jgi:hypothetical protein
MEIFGGESVGVRKGGWRKIISLSSLSREPSRENEEQPPGERELLRNKF